MYAIITPHNDIVSNAGRYLSHKRYRPFACPTDSSKVAVADECHEHEIKPDTPAFYARNVWPMHLGITHKSPRCSILALQSLRDKIG